MRLRVLDDERPGYALLEFDGALNQRTLLLSVRSVHRGTFLGPLGEWQKVPHYFAAEPVGDSATPTQFRVGPDIVNHISEYDRIEVATADGGVCAETLWENAIPQMTGSVATHSVYRPQVIEETAIPAETVQPPPAPEPVQEEPTRQIQEPPATPAFTPAERKAEELQGDRKAAVPPSWKKGAVLVGVLALLGMAATLALPQMRCRLLGISCAEPSTRNRDLADAALKKAKACALPLSDANPCEVSSCFSDYLAMVPATDVELEAKQILGSAAGVCPLRRDDEAAKMARACAASKTAGIPACDVRSQCTTPYSTAFPSGASRAELDALAARSDRICEDAKRQQDVRDAQQRAAAARDRASQDARQSLQAAQQCAASASACVAVRCYDNYIAKFGSSAGQGSDAQAEIARLKGLCPTSQIADGSYFARSNRSCGARLQSVTVEIRQGRISWAHDFQGTSYQWTGIIDPSGNIRASVANNSAYSAIGQYSEDQRHLEMRYPQCGSESISMEIQQRTR
jgi:hypothetical protein